MSLRLFRIVGLEGLAHTIQLGVFPSIREVKTNPYHTILIDMYGFVFYYHLIPFNFCECVWQLPIVKPS